jgi:hypothetical protein
MLLTNDRGVPSRPAGVRCEQGTATARPSKRVPYSVQQTGGDDRCSRDKNGCDQVMQHAVGHMTLLRWPWVWKGHPLLLVSKSANAEALFTLRAIGSAHGAEGKGPGIGHDTRALLALGAIYSLKLDALMLSMLRTNCLILHRVDDATQRYAALIGNRD